MLDFTRDKKRFIAGRGFMTAFDENGDEELHVMDVFRDRDPTEEQVYELYKTCKDITNEK